MPTAARAIDRRSDGGRKILDHAIDRHVNPTEAVQLGAQPVVLDPSHHDDGGLGAGRALRAKDVDGRSRRAVAAKDDAIGRCRSRYRS
jgi:hypothetical protein